MTFEKNVLLAPYTSLNIGGPAEYFFVAESEEALTQAIAEAQGRSLPVTILSGGTNVLIADRGIAGLVILNRIRGIEEDGMRLRAGAGTPVSEVVARSVSLGLAGLSWAGGLPGTLGGAIYGNAGTFQRAIGEVVESVRYIDENGEFRERSGSECGFRYRTSVFKEKLRGAVITSAVFALTRGDKEKLQQEMLEAIQWRNEHQPGALMTAGSFFRNAELPEGFALPEGKHPGQGSNKVPAGWMIDKLGLKGKQIGGAKVSEMHANFIVNDGDATAEDVRRLVAFIKEKVRERFGVELEEEVRYLGFPDKRDA